MAALVMLLTSVGCMPDIGEDEPPSGERIQPIFDPDAENIPLPNTAALDEDGTLPSLEGAGDDDANGQFLDWLSSLHGWLPSTGIEIPFDGTLQTNDQGNLPAEPFHLFRLEDGKLAEELPIDTVTYQETKQPVANDQGKIVEVDGSLATVMPEDPLDSSTDYAVVVENSLKDGDGNEIREPQAIFFAESQEPLVDENGVKTIDSLPDNQTARDLEGLRNLLMPVYQGLADPPDGIDALDRNEIAMSFRWTTVQDPKTIVDPATATLPLPNEIALDDDGTFPEAAVAPLNCPGPDETSEDIDQTAQEHFNCFLDQTENWPTTTPITLPIDGAVREQTVGTETVELWRLPPEGEGAPEQVALADVEFDEEAGTITLVPAEELPNRTQFVAFATNEVENEQGFSLKLPVALQMAIQPFDILDSNGESSVPRIPTEDAKSSQGIRDTLREPTQRIVDETDFSLGDFGAIWTWTTWTDSFVVFDPANGVLSIPNEFVRRGEMGRVSLPTEGLEGVEREIVESLNERFGFSTSADGWIPLNGKIDESTLTDESLKFMFVKGIPSVYDPARYEATYKPEFDQIIVTPKVPWNDDDARDTTNDDIQNAGVVTTEMMGANGRPVQPSPAFVFLRSPAPLVDNQGESTVEQLDDATAQQLEEARKTFNTLLSLAGNIPDLGVEKRQEVALAYAFHPQNTNQQAEEHRAMALAKLEDRFFQGVRRACESTQAGCSPDPNLEDMPGMSNVAMIQRAAEFSTVDFLDANNRLKSFESAAGQTVGITVYVPKRSNCPNVGADEGFDVVIAQHGLGGWRTGAGDAIANDLAGECLATVAMDLPEHGCRTPGTSSLHPTENPMDSGANFLSLDLVGSKNKMLQSVVDLSVLAEIVSNDELEAAIDNDPSTNWFAYENDNDIGYVAHSLGGFIGYPFVSVDSNVTVAVTNGTGGKFSRVLTEGTIGGDIVGALEDAGIMEGTFDRVRALAFIQWLADPVDPFAFAPFVQENPLPETTFDPQMGQFSTGSALEANEMLLQMSTDPQEMDDPVVPNATTELLAEAANLYPKEQGMQSRTLEDSTYSAEHGFLFDQTMGNIQADCARRQAAAWLSSGLTEGETAFYPDSLTASNCTSN